MIALFTVPAVKSEAVAQKQLKRHPTITATHTTRTALRKAGVAAVQMVIMPPSEGQVTIILLSNVVPPNSREEWRAALDPQHPLTWRNYQLAPAPKGKALTWRLSDAARKHYRNRIARLITGRGRLRAPRSEAKPQLSPGAKVTKASTGSKSEKRRLKPYMLPDETAYAQVQLLAQHLGHYPGFSGVRADIFQLARYATRVWKSTRPKHPYYQWPTHPYLRFRQPQIAPLSELLESGHEQKQKDVSNEDPSHVRSERAEEERPATGDQRRGVKVGAR